MTRMMVTSRRLRTSFVRAANASITRLLVWVDPQHPMRSQRDTTIWSVTSFYVLAFMTTRLGSGNEGDDRAELPPGLWLAFLLNTLVGTHLDMPFCYVQFFLQAAVVERSVNEKRVRRDMCDVVSSDGTLLASLPVQDAGAFALNEVALGTYTRRVVYTLAAPTTSRSTCTSDRRRAAGRVFRRHATDSGTCRPTPCHNKCVGPDQAMAYILHPVSSARDMDFVSA